MTVLITGSRGQLGIALQKCPGLADDNIIAVDENDCDITKKETVAAFIHKTKPDAVINCAAYTAVDLAESEPEKCFSVNVQGTENLAAVCARTGAKLVQISTDYVFSGVGEKPYETKDATGPLNVYGKSKLRSEEIVRSSLNKYFIIRTSWMFGEGKNFVNTMINLSRQHNMVRVIFDQIGSPTYAPDLAGLISDMIKTDKYGTYHATNEGFCSWADFAEEIFRLLGVDVCVKRITSEEFGAAAERPRNSRLSKAGLDFSGFKRLPDWQNALSRYLSGCKNER